MLDESPAPDHQFTFSERYIVDVSNPLPEFNTAGGKAFMVTDRENTSLALYAFVQTKTIPARFDLLIDLMKNKIPGLVCPYDYGLMKLDLEGGIERLVIIFDRPLGGCLFINEQVNKRLTVAILRETVPLAFARTLAVLHSRKIIHRQIRPETLFFESESGNAEIIIGECITVPPGYGMYLDLEPIEVMFADPASRGLATQAADMYQMGVCILTYFKNRPVWKDRTRDISIKTRTQHSSYLALALGEGIAGSLVNLIKGLMNDEIENRWDINDVINWFEGNKKRDVPTKKVWGLNRPVQFNGQSYLDRRILADAFAKFPKEALKFIYNLDFTSWIVEVIRSEVLEERVEILLGIHSLEDIGTILTKNDHILLARVCMHLHPGGPIRYKGLSIQIDSMPTTFAAIMASGSLDQEAAIIDILNDKFLLALAEIVGQRDMEFSNHVVSVKKITGTANSDSLGRGLERVLYNLNPDMPCLSAKFENVWIDDVGKFALALNSSANRDFIKSVIFDRHVAAYIASRNDVYARVINSFAVTEKDPSRFAIVALDFFAAVQIEYGLPTMNHLTNLLIESLQVTVNDLKNKKRREKVKAMLEKMKRSGDITKLTSQLDFGKIQALDKQEFLQARAIVYGIERQKKQLSHKFSARDFQSKLVGYKWIRAISFIIFLTSIFQVTM